MIHIFKEMQEKLWVGRLGPTSKPNQITVARIKLVPNLSDSSIKYHWWNCKYRNREISMYLSIY